MGGIKKSLSATPLSNLIPHASLLVILLAHNPYTDVICCLLLSVAVPKCLSKERNLAA